MSDWSGAPGSRVWQQNTLPDPSRSRAAAAVVPGTDKAQGLRRGRGRRRSIAVDEGDGYLAAVTADLGEAASSSVRVYQIGRRPAQVPRRPRPTAENRTTPATERRTHHSPQGRQNPRDGTPDTILPTGETLNPKHITPAAAIPGCGRLLPDALHPDT